jgi:multidrug efflux system membrane fusion protein
MSSTDHPAVGGRQFPATGRFQPWNWAKRHKWLVGGLLLLLLGLLIFVRHSSNTATPPGGHAGGMPTAVNTAKAETGDVPVILNGLGTVTPLATVTVVTQIAGQLQQLYFTEGQIVKKGDPIALIDPRPYENALEQAQGQLAHDQALLADAEKDLKRYEVLVKQDSIASQTLDTQAALVQQDKGLLITDQANIDTAKLNIAYCHIVSPVTGRVGLRQVDAGNYITPSSTTNGIVVITQLQPISVIFPLPEDNVIAVTKPLHAGATLPAIAMDRSNTTKLATGTLSNIDNQIDTATGMFKLRAQFDNADESLFPNQFVNIQLQVDTLKNQTVVPTAAIQRGAPGTFVYVVNPDSTVSVKPVKLGISQGERQVILSGIEPGDTVVTDGVDRLRDGAKVVLPGAQPPTGGNGGGRRHHHQDGSAPEGGQSGGTPPAGQSAGNPDSPQKQ